MKCLPKTLGLNIGRSRSAVDTAVYVLVLKTTSNACASMKKFGQRNAVKRCDPTLHPYLNPIPFKLPNRRGSVIMLTVKIQTRDNTITVLQMHRCLKRHLIII